MKYVKKIKLDNAPKMKISLLVACFNEEKSLRKSIRSCLNQTRKFDEMIYVDDSSTDKTPVILNKYSVNPKYSNFLKAVRTPRNTGNKSSAQEFGLQFITGDIFVVTDADTFLDKHFVKEIEKSFVDNAGAAAVAGYVRSLPYNWLTLCRSFEYTIGQKVHKQAEYFMSYIFVIPGAASAFRSDIFRENVSFDHDTITEDLDFTYKLHEKNFKIFYNSKAVIYTQDPIDLKNYINQTRRWFGGGWQNLIKHWNSIPESPMRSFEISLIYGEGVVFSVVFLIIPFINLWVELLFLVGYFVITSLFAIWAARTERRPSIMLVPFVYILLLYINAYIYLEQFYLEIILRKKNLKWFKPDRFIFKSKIFK
ncbi:MAG: glycosyltransferase family 2 protein [Candidatus Magasanikbacteria bacterium]|nr:glycosyltransferase family 2 protein [Candidatus Magasanikbacteria bacterium]